MNTKFLFLLVILIASVLVFVWGTTNYLRCYTDTPNLNSFELCPTNIDVYAMPAFIATLVVIGIIPVTIWIYFRNQKYRIIFAILSGVGLFFVFVGILFLIIQIRN